MIGTMLRSRSAPADLGPGELRHHHVEDDHVVAAARAQPSSASSPSAAVVDLEALGAQRVADRRDDVRLVVGEQDAGLIARSDAAAVDCGLRERDAHRRAAARRGLELDRAAERAHGLADDREPEAEAARRRASPR